MREIDLTVQACGCIALPEDVAAQLGALPGAVVRLSLDHSSATLHVLSMSDTAAIDPLAVCPVLLAES